MRIPTEQRELGGLVVSPRDVDGDAWQAHVLKHPFGLGALYNLPGAKGRRWTSEGWGTLEPPVLAEGERAALVALIQGLDVDGARCGAKRLERTEYHGDAPYGRVPCYECPRRLVDPCTEVTTEVGARYADWVERAMDLLSDGELVPRAVATKLMFANLREADPLPSAVLSTGWLPRNRKGARINTSDGVRVDFYLNRGALEWRTTYREPAHALQDRISRLTHVLPAIPRIPLSGKVLVPRQWWQRNANV